MSKISHNQVKNAGNYLKRWEISSSEDFNKAMDILSYWRSSHEKHLSNAFIEVQKIAQKIDTKCIYAKRLKRYPSIIKKLQRFDKMKLPAMQDVWGCRVVVADKKKLIKLIRAIKNNHFFRSKNRIVKVNDYTDIPKPDGYRSYHIVGSFLNSWVERKIEVQLRTAIQHSWATTLEIVDIFTNQSLKTNNGDEKWGNFFLHMSKLLYAIEDIHLFNPQDQTFKKEFLEKLDKHKLGKSLTVVQNLCKKMKIIDTLNGFTASVKLVNEKVLNEVEGQAYILIMIDVNEKEIKVQKFHKDNAKYAEAEYTKNEKEHIEDSSIIIALISTSSLWEIKDAYPNYFADSKNFLKYLHFINNID